MINFHNIDCMEPKRKQSKEHIRKRAEAKKNGMNFNCLTCGKEFYRSKSHIDAGDCKFCCRACYQQSSLNRCKKPYISEIRKREGSEHNGNWRGGITPINLKIRNSEEYKRWRLSVFERDNYTCLMCGFRSGKGKYIQIHAHHIKSFSRHPDLKFKLNNGETLCVECHKTTDNYKGKGISRK